MKIAILGYGKMGKTIERFAVQKGHSIVYKSGSDFIEGTLSEADVAIEFSTPKTAATNILACFDLGIPVVSGTTGWLDAFEEILRKCEDCNGSFVYASNFSIGMNLFFKLNAYASTLLSPWKEYKVSIEEIHHTQKKDAPSGSAISLAKGIIQHSNKVGWKLGKATDNEIEITAKRIEDVKGTHIVSYESPIDSLSLKHEAHSRDGFAVGAIIAAEWLQNKKGVYTMDDVLQIK
jgi:4-hydroxy-tetrahydrodipicolinate reductase